MNFMPNEDQSMLQDSVDKFIRNHYTAEHRQQSINQCHSLNPETWQHFADMGWLALPFSEADGGIGGDLSDTMLLMQGLGHGLVVEPYIASIVLGGGLLRRASDKQREQWIPPLIRGEIQLAVAIDEYEQAHDPKETQMTASTEAKHFLLNGTKCHVLNGSQADHILVLARSAGEPGDSYGLSLFMVPAETTGLSRHIYKTVDGQSAAEIQLHNVEVDAELVIGPLHKAYELTQTVIHETILALCAEASGAVEKLITDTVEYAKTRKQFGVHIGSFQALQHRMADMYMHGEQLQSLLLAATLRYQEGHPDALTALHALKAHIGTAVRKVGQEAIQIHGGMGMTDELIIGHYFKRITAIDALFGNADSHLHAIRTFG